LYDIGHQDGLDYLVMECVEGETLSKRLERGPLPVDQVLKYGAQMADALDKAHRSGLVHRDVKPSNIMLTPTGAKLLDFGLAKPTVQLASGATLTAALPPSPVTEQGTVVGTFQYMSPEQVEGKEVDSRSDIFALGAVIYEMLTGKRAFEGKSRLSVASAILEREPAPISTIKPLAPLALDHVIRKCIAKSEDDRWQSASDLASELKWIAESGSSAGAAAVERQANRSREKAAWVVAGLCLLALIAALFWFGKSKPQQEAMYFPAPMQVPARDIAVAPNGHTVAVVAYLESARKNAIWIYELGSPKATPLAGTEGGDYPFWSPDSKSLGFFADWKLKRLDISGGPVQTLCDTRFGRGGAWNKDGMIIFTPDVIGGLYRVPASGGTPAVLTTTDRARGQVSHRWPMFLPDQNHYLFLNANFADAKSPNAVYVGALDSKETHLVVASDGNAAYAAGYLLFYRDKTLLAQPFDAKRFAVTGSQTTILADVQFMPQVKKATFGVSNDGVLLAQSAGGMVLSQPAWFDRKGNQLGAVGKPDVFGNVFLAPNGKSVAVDKTDVTNQNTIDVWTYESTGDHPTRVTFSSGIEMVPVWSPDSSSLVVMWNRQATQDVIVKSADGSQEDKLVLQSDGDAIPNDWSRDAKSILYGCGAGLCYLSFPDGKNNTFVKAVASVRNGQFSPDGRWVAYASNETGRWEIYATSFPDARVKRQVTTAGGEQPRWNGNGKELFFLSPDEKIMAVPVSTGEKFDSGTPAPLFQATPRQPITNAELFVYDVSRDGQRFLINTPVKQSEATPMSVILNWPAKLGK